MKLVEKVKALFADEAKVEMKDTFVKTEDGKIISIKNSELAVDASVVFLDEAGVESAIEDGDYILDDKRVITVKESKVVNIADAVEEAVEEVDEVENMKTKTKMEAVSLVEGEYVTLDGTKLLVDAEGKVEVVLAEVESVEEEMSIETPIEEVKDEKFSSLEERIVQLETLLAAKDSQIEKATKEFNKLKSAPAAVAIDTRKVEKVETKLSKTNSNSMLQKVMEITNSNK